MKTFIVACGVLTLTVLFLVLALDAGAREADLGLFLAPVNSLCGLSLCIFAFRRRLIWVGALGLSMMAIWPFFSLALALQDGGILRQLAIGTIAAAYALFALSCFYSIKKSEWGSLRNTQGQ